MEQTHNDKLQSWDIAVIVIYLLVSLALGLYTVVKNKASLENVFLAGRSMTWWPIALSMFASNIGCVNFVGLAGTAASSGLAIIMFEWNAAFLLVLLGWVFLPVYLASGIYTMPEYLARRFGGKRLRIYLSTIALITYLFGTVSSDLYTAALFMVQGLNMDFNVSIAVLLIITLIFTGLGGLETVIITDALAVIVIVLGGVLLCILGLIRVDGLGALKESYLHSVPNVTLGNSTSLQYLVNSTCGHPREDAWHIFRHPWRSDFPSVALFIRTTIGSLWYWCANQVVIQRALAAKNMTHAKASCVFAGYIKFLPLFIMVLPGMISRTLYPNEVACADPDTCMEVCGSPMGCSNIALPKLALSLLPIGLRGLYVAAMIAATVSTLTSVFNSSSSLFAVDIWHSIRKNASERELLIAGRLFLIGMVTVAVIWIPVMTQAQGGQIYKYVTTIGGLMGAPTCVLFLLAILWHRCNEQGAFWGMVIAQTWGMIRFVMDIVYPSPVCGKEDTRPGLLSDFNGFYHAASQLVLALVVAVGISLVTKPPTKDKIAGLTFWTRRHRTRSMGEVTTSDQNESCNIDEKETTVIEENEEFESNMEIQTETSSKTNSLLSTIWRHIQASVCGTQSLGQKSFTKRDLDADYNVRMARIKETPFWKTFMDVQAVLLIITTVVLYGLFF